MGTKEAIEFLENSILWNLGDEAPIGKEKYVDYINNTIDLLQQGEAYKKIVEEMESVHCGKDGEFGYNRRKLVKKLKQKYLKGDDN